MPISIPPGFPPVDAHRMSYLPPYLIGRINMLNDELRAKGVDVIDLGMGNPVDPVQPEVIETMKTSLADVKNHRYSQAKGILPLKEAFSRHYQRHYNVELDPKTEVIATIGSKEAFSHLCLAILGPNDSLVVPTPAFTIHMYAPIIAGAHPIGVFQDEEQPGAKLLGDIKRVFETVRPRPKFLVLNYPHNPTAKTVDLGFYEEAVAMARHFKFWLLNDFAYGHSCFDGYKAPSVLQVKGAKEVAVETFTMSKPYNMAGWRVGFLCGNPHMIDALGRIKGYFDYGIFQSVQLSAATALDHGDGFIKQQSKVYQTRNSPTASRSRTSLIPPLPATTWNSSGESTCWCTNARSLR